MSHLPTYGAPPPSGHASARSAPPQVTIRAMTHRDVGRVAAIEAGAHPIDAWPAEAFSAAVDGLRTYVCRVAVDAAGDVVAYVVASVAADQADVQNLTVRADARRRGLARRLLDQLLSEVAVRGAREVFLEVRHDNAPAIALYASWGFTVRGRRRDYYARGVDAIVMRAPTWSRCRPAVPRGE